MSTIANQIQSSLPAGMHLPESLEKLFVWIESNGLYVDQPSGTRIGFLYPQEKMRSQATEDGRPGGTDIAFEAVGNSDLNHWFGHERPEVLNRLYVFAKTGADGSMAAFWLNEEGQQVIVHLGSGSGSTMVCILAEDPVDFIRLLAIGYDEICWGEHFDVTPEETDPDFIVAPNLPFRKWVERTFGRKIPETGHEIVRNPEDMGAEDPLDTFNRWVSENTA